jgi:polysaccharide pyruvyl transferase WcaK-like protein
VKQFDKLRVLIDRIPYAAGNIGEEAVLASLLQDLENCGVRTITVLDNQPNRTERRHAGKIRVLPDQLAYWLSLPVELKLFDLLIWGGGHMLQDRSSQLYIPYVVKTLLLAKLLRVPRFIYAPGLGPVVNRLGRTLSKWALDGSETLVVRDEGSLQFLKEIGIGDGAELTADPAFSLKTPFDDVEPPESAVPVIGFAPRRLFYRKGSVLPVAWQLAAQRNENRQFENFLQDAAAALDLLIERDHADVRLIPMDIGPNPRDDLVCHRLRSYMTYGDRVRIFDDDPPLGEFIRRLGELDLLISARLHGIILGLRFGLPFIGIDSDGKILQLTNGLGLGDFVIKDREFNREVFLDLVKRVLAKKRELRAELIERNHELSARAAGNCDLLKKCLRTIVESDQEPSKS